MSSWKNVSLRIRLLSLYVLLLGASVMAVGTYSYYNTRRMLLHNTATRLRAQAKPVIEHWLYSRGQGGVEAVAQGKTPALTLIAPGLARDLTSRDTIAIILSKKGEELANGKLLPEEPDPPPADPLFYRQALAGDNEVDYISEFNGKRLLTLLIPLRASPTSDKILGVVQLSTPLDKVDQLLLDYRLMLVGTSAGVLLLGAMAGLVLIGTALKGLRRMAETCERISEGDLSQRVNLPHYGDEIGRLASAFDNMVDRIERTFEAQQRFVAKSAHELRTPLTALRGSLEVLLRGAQDDPAAVARLTQGMHREVLRLSRLCEQLLDLTKLDVSSNINKQTVNLNEFFGNFIQQARVLAQNRQVVLKQGPFVLVVVDPDMLEQILFNLLHNAVQHTKRGGKIIIGWKLIPAHVQIWVADDGEGIAPEDLSRIFEPFYQGKGSTFRQEKGTGLGLTLTRAMVQAHGGQLTVESELGQGSVFSFNLPLK